MRSIEADITIPVRFFLHLLFHQKFVIKEFGQFSFKIQELYIHHREENNLIHMYR